MKCTKNILIGTTAVVAAAGVGFAVLPAFASDGGTSTNAASHTGHGGGETVTVQGERAAVAQGKGALLFVSSLNGANEVPVRSGPAVGDRDGVALQFVKVHGDKVSVAVKFRGTDKPTALHIHQGAKGTNGGVKVDFTPLLARGTEPVKGWAGAVSGTVKVKDRAVLDAFKANPRGFYANLHTARFPGGAVRGQFHRVTSAFPFDKALSNFQASVIKGQQIYRCEKGAGGRYAFQQHDVRATLGGPIAHSFVAPGSGKPQWIAADRSAVTGTLISKSPNGAGNIAELDIRAKQSGKKKGLLAKSQEILRLNTVGGVAPAGNCAKGKIVGVPYGADYVFIQK
ncbi:CHRD domain-containing protein [Streptomyces albipurpureus]|uniref:CHRD domain-containing protein n=1 Tax=Streptomyces albipurpureus TaxID=2897419 RepID=A0ABT0UZF2_9ACTN|nr:CHRD domain-containing protein [Streptomyces sp. CWNU-1]MCM2393952.1 CHRD domain-containing protein [Streptomyces sp. CWNU-1]